MSENKLQEEGPDAYAEQNNAMSLDHYQMLVDQNEAGIFSLEHRIITYSNRAFANILNTIPEKLVGRSILDFVEDKDWEILSSGLTQMIQGKQEIFSRDLRLKNESPNCIYFSLHLKAVAQESGIVKIIGASRNASSRVSKSIVLSRTQARYEALYRHIIDGVIIYDYLHEEVIDCNAAALRILGYDNLEDLQKINRYDFIPKTSNHFPGEDLHKITKEHGERVMKGEAFHTPGVLISKNNQEVIANVNVVPTFHTTGEAYVIFQDITKKVLREIKQKQRDKRYRDIFENSHEAIIVTDIKTKKPVMINNNTLKLLGISSFEEKLKYPLHNFFIDTTIDGLTSEEYIDKQREIAINTGRSSFSLKLKKKTGEIIWITAVLIGDKSNPKSPKIISFIRDTTHLNNARKDLNKKNEELKKYIESNLQLENFAYFASHDLQTPLRSITSFTQLLQKSLKGRLSSEEEEYMSFIVSSSKNMRRLINDLLSFSRVNTTGIKLHKIDIHDLLHTLLSELNTLTQKKQAIVTIDKMPESIKADRTKVRQVFQNLLTNALKFMDSNQQPKVHISCIEKEQEWLFAIKDNGIGIAPEYQEKIFLMFKRLHGNEEYEGTGIGLAMVKKIIAQHGGKIWVESELGAGTTFWFTIQKESALLPT